MAFIQITIMFIKMLIKNSYDNIYVPVTERFQSKYFFIHFPRVKSGSKKIVRFLKHSKGYNYLIKMSLRTCPMTPSKFLIGPI